jgi:GntR family transcriptional regulator
MLTKESSTPVRYQKQCWSTFLELDRQSPTPLYQQLYSLLRSRIEQGELNAGDAIPSEKQLMATYGLSRVTTRRALQLLADESLIIRQPGKGSFVTVKRLQENLSSLRGFAEMIRDRYPDHVMEVQSFEATLVDSVIQQILKLKADEQILTIKRRHMLDDLPLAYVNIFLPYEIGSLLNVKEVSNTPIYTLLMQKLGVMIKTARQTISAVAATTDIAAQLEVPENAPVLMVKRVTYSEDDIPLEYIELYYPGERHELVMDLHRDSMQMHTA